MSGLTSNDNTIVPSLAKLMAELFDWNEGEEDAVLANDSLCEYVEIFSTSVIPSLLPPTVALVAPSLPLIVPLIVSLMSSLDKLFFVSHRLPGSSVTELSLVQVAMRDSFREHPNGTQVNFYTCHPKEKLFNAVNQHY